MKNSERVVASVSKLLHNWNTEIWLEAEEGVAEPAGYNGNRLCHKTEVKGSIMMKTVGIRTHVENVFATIYRIATLHINILHAFWVGRFIIPILWSHNHEHVNMYLCEIYFKSIPNLCKQELFTNGLI